MSYNQFEISNFTKTTGFKPSKAWNIFAKYGPHNSIGGHKYFLGIFGSDHTLVWHKSGAYLITTEPYQKNNEYNKTLSKFCHDYEWQLLLSKHPGFWNPPHTKLYLLSPPNIGIEVQDIEDKIATAG